jgi:hypothetical protein
VRAHLEALKRTIKTAGLWLPGEAVRVAIEAMRVPIEVVRVLMEVLKIIETLSITMPRKCCGSTEIEILRVEAVRKVL